MFHRPPEWYVEITMLSRRQVCPTAQTPRQRQRRQRRSRQPHSAAAAVPHRWRVRRRSRRFACRAASAPPAQPLPLSQLRRKPRQVTSTVACLAILTPCNDTLYTDGISHAHTVSSCALLGKFEFPTVCSNTLPGSGCIFYFPKM